MNIATTKQRILQLLDYKELKLKDFYELTGIKRGFLDADKLESSVSDVFLAIIIAKFPDVDPIWLLTGEGEMIKDPEIQLTQAMEPQVAYRKTESARVVDNMGVLNAPLVGQYAYAGYLSGYSDPEYVERLPTVPFLIPEGMTAKGKYRAFEVRGESYNDGSSDSILEGDILLGRFINPDLYRDGKLHINKWLFIIVHKEEGILIKRIKNHDVQEGTIELQSLNPLYENQVIHLRDVSEIYNVVQFIRKPKAY